MIIGGIVAMAGGFLGGLGGGTDPTTKLLTSIQNSIEEIHGEIQQIGETLTEMKNQLDEITDLVKDLIDEKLLDGFDQINHYTDQLKTHLQEAMDHEGEPILEDTIILCEQIIASFIGK